MSHNQDHSETEALQRIAGHQKRDVHRMGQHVVQCNGCGRKLEAGESVVVYAVFKRVPGSDGPVWHPLATFCSGVSSRKYCSPGRVEDVEDEDVGQPDGRPGYERYWSHKPEMLVHGTYMERDVPENIIKFAASTVYDSSFGPVPVVGNSSEDGEVAE